MNPVFRLVFLAVVWILWLFPFARRRVQGEQKAQTVVRAARWGILLAAAGFGIVFTHGPKQWSSPWPVWRLLLAVPFAFMAILLSHTAVRNLGRQWRVDAGLNADHELVRTGPYRIVRHPIYASMLCIILAASAAIGTLPGWPIGLVLFIIGTEIRIRIEDGLLRGRFGEQFEAWKRRVPAYIPFIR
jgi:protein-S-isoprenylcysteine O-methyltransferase Ste14